MEAIIVGIIIALAGLGGGTVIALSGGVKIDNRAITSVETTTIQNVGQTTIVEKAIRGARYALTNGRELAAILDPLEEWQRREARFAYDPIALRWAVQYPIPAIEGRTNTTALTVTNTRDGKAVTNKTNF